MNRYFSLTLITCTAVLLSAGDLFGIPAFARKYNMSCKTCHSPFPYLKPYGNDFAGNGFELSDQEAPRYFVETGDPELSLLRDVPLAMRLEGYLTYNESNNEGSDFTTPLLFKLLSGGAIAKDVSYYVYYILENGERGKIEDAWLMFNNLFSSELDVTLGQFQVCDPLFKRELRLTRDDYYIYKVRPGHSNVDLTYDRGIMLGYGFDSGTDIAVEVVNGSGIGEGIEGTFDTDKYKNVFGRISQDVGEYFRIGAMGYYGNEMQEELNEIKMYGGDATISLAQFELNLQYLERIDDNPFFYSSEDIDAIPGLVPERNTKGGFAELLFRPEGDDSKWYAAALFNWIESEQESNDYKTVTAHWGYVLRRNIRLTTEFRYNFSDEYGQFGVGFVTAF